MKLRPAAESDQDQLTRIRGEGIASYASFAPDGWQPVDESKGAPLVQARMFDGRHWAFVAEEDGALLGYVAMGPAMTGWSEGDDIPGTAYLWQLFVDMGRHRRGLGRALHDAGMDEARARGYTRALVRIAEGAEQARAFYDACGWRVTGRYEDPFLELPTLIAELEL
jgi:ribosomal protein S18 acetylase RimI-like enzyme